MKLPSLFRSQKLSAAPVAVSFAEPAKTLTPPRSGAATQRQGSPSPGGTTPPRYAYFEALTNNGERAPVPFTSFLNLTAPSLLQSLNRDMLVGLSRYIADNYGLAIYALELKKTYSCPVTISAATGNAEWDLLADRWWQNLLHRIDFTGRFHFDTLQGLWCKALDVDADVGLVVTDQAGFPQVQTIDSVLIRAPQGAERAWGGVQQDEFGRVVGYHVASWPGQIVPEPQFLLLYEPNNSGDYRPNPTMASHGGNDIRDANETRAYEKRRQKVKSSLVAVMKTPTGTMEPDEWGNDEDETPEATAPKFDQRTGIASLGGGDIPIVPEGYELKAPDLGPIEADAFQTMQDNLVSHFCYAIKMPPAFVLDAKLTGPNQRAVNDKFMKVARDRCKTITRAAVWVRTRCIAWAIAKGELPEINGWERVSTQAPAELSIDTGKAASDREAVSMALMSRRELYGQRSLNADRERNQIQREDESIIKWCREVAGQDNALLDRLLARHLPTRSVSFPITPDTSSNAPA